MGHSSHEPWLYQDDEGRLEAQAAAADEVAWQRGLTDAPAPRGLETPPAPSRGPEAWAQWQAAHPCEAAVIQTTYRRLIGKSQKQATAYLVAAKAARIAREQ